MLFSSINTFYNNVFCRAEWSKKKQNYFLNIHDTNNHIHKLCVDNLIDSLKLFNLFRWKWVQMKEKYNGEKKKKVFSSVSEHDVLAYKIISESDHWLCLQDFDIEIENQMQ